MPIFAQHVAPTGNQLVGRQAVPHFSIMLLILREWWLQLEAFSGETGHITVTEVVP